MKKIILVIVLILPFVVKADCNYEKHEEYVGFANRISYENNYSKSSGRFNITIYNVVSGLRVNYNKKDYDIRSDNTVLIEDIPEGSSVSINIYADDGCSEVKIISLTEPYYNEYYNTSICSGYEDKLIYCSSQFTSIKPTEELIKIAKKNYDNSFEEKEEEVVPEKPESFYSKLIAFGMNWGIKIILALITIVVSVSFYNSKLRRIKHGI